MSAGGERWSSAVRADGFTLIEVVGALVIFSVGVLMVMRAGSTLTTQMRYSGARSELVVLANAQLDSIEATPFDSLTSGSATDTLTVQGWTYERSITVTLLTPVLGRVEVDFTPVGDLGPAPRPDVVHFRGLVGRVIVGPMRAAGGFTLVETLIALVLSSFVVLLASHAFLVQNQFYSMQTIRVGVQDNARAATELMAREVRNATQDGVVVAGSRTLTVRSPIVMAVVCHRQGSPNADVLTEGGQDAIDTGAVAGVAVRNDSTWEYVRPPTWSSIDGLDTDAAADCAGNGADTVGVRPDFHRLNNLNTLIPSGVDEGDVVMLFRETTFSIRTSQLDGTTLGLFRADYGEAAVEFATGIDTTAHFQYRTSAGTYVDTVTAGALGDVDAVRIVLESRRPPATGGADDITFGWSVNVPLRNVREGGN